MLTVLTMQPNLCITRTWRSEYEDGGNVLFCLAYSIYLRLSLHLFVKNFEARRESFQHAKF